MDGGRPREGALNSALAESLRIHNENQNMYYLGEGSPGEVARCRDILKSVRNLAACHAHAFFTSDEGIPQHPSFSII